MEIKSVDGTPFDGLGTPYDGKAWHTYTLDWLPGKLVYHIDAVKVYETPAGESVPAMPMALGLQMFVAANNDGWYGGGPDRTTPRKVNLHVDYVKVYESDATRSSGDRASTQQASAETAPSDTLTVQSEATAEGQVVRGSPRDEVLSGGPGPDIFVPGGGRDRVPDFAPGADKLRLTAAPEQVKTFAATQDGVEGLMVLYDGLNTVFLPNGPGRELAADDLIFG